MFKIRYRLGIILLFFISIIILSPVHASLEYSDESEFECGFKDLIIAVNKTVTVMGLVVKRSTINDDNTYAYFAMEKAPKIFTTEKRVFLRAVITKMNSTVQLEATVDSYGIAYVPQKSINRRLLFDFMDNVKKYVEQPEAGHPVKQCPTCKQPIDLECTQCNNCHSFLGFIKSPGNFRAVCAHLGEVVLSWKDESNNEEGFYIERKIGNEEYLEVANVGRDTSYYKDQNIISGKTYSYRIRAFNNECYSEYTPEVKISIP